MTTSIIIPGLSSTTKNPQFFGETRYAAGQITAGSIPLTLLVAGNKTAAGSMTANGTPILVTSADEVDASSGPGSEIAMLAYGIDGHGGALATPGVALWIGCIAEATSGPVAATATITIGGAPTSTGTYRYRLSGIPFSVGVASSELTTLTATNIRDAINSNPRMPFTATVLGSVVTITAKNVGPRGNWHTLFQDDTARPTGGTSVIAGGTTLTGGGKRFTGGAGADDPTALLATINATQFDRIAPACGDSTLDAVNVALWKAQINSLAGPTVGILEHAVIASNDTLTNAASLSVTTLNDARWQVLHMLNGETHPCAHAGAVAAMRTAGEKFDPCSAYDYTAVPGLAPQSQAADRPSGATIETALSEGVTECTTTTDGQAVITRSIVTRCRLGATPDYRVLDTSDAYVPDFVRKAVKLLWDTQVKPNNPRVGDDVPIEIKSSEAGVLTPSAWNADVFKILKDYEAGIGIESGLSILQDVDANPPVSQYDGIGRRIMTICPTIPRFNNHSVGVSVRQVTPS